MAERGPAGLTVWDVARQAGVNRGTAYQQFRSRDALINAVLEDVVLRAKSDFAKPAEHRPHERLDKWVEYFVANPELVRISVFRMLAADLHPRHDLWIDFVNDVRRGARHRRRSGGFDAEMLASILLGAVVFWSLRVQSGGARQSNTARFVRELKRLLLYRMASPAVHADADADSLVMPRSESANPARRSPPARRGSRQR